MHNISLISNRWSWISRLAQYIYPCVNQPRTHDRVFSYPFLWPSLQTNNQPSLIPNKLGSETWIPFCHIQFTATSIKGSNEIKYLAITPTSVNFSIPLSLSSKKKNSPNQIIKEKRNRRNPKSSSSFKLFAQLFAPALHNTLRLVSFHLFLRWSIKAVTILISSLQNLECPKGYIPSVILFYTPTYNTIPHILPSSKHSHTELHPTTTSLDCLTSELKQTLA